MLNNVRLRAASEQLTAVFFS